jgi:hypothetical protein
MRKCVLLCANCHRECEAGLISCDEITRIHRDRWALINQERRGLGPSTI